MQESTAALSANPADVGRQVNFTGSGALPDTTPDAEVIGRTLGPGTYLWALPVRGAGEAHVSLGFSATTGTVPTASLYKLLLNGHDEELDQNGTSQAVAFGTFVAGTPLTATLTGLAGEQKIMVKVIVPGGATATVNVAEYRAGDGGSSGGGGVGGGDASAANQSTEIATLEDIDVDVEALGTKLDTVHTDLGTTLHADVDQLEGYVDGVEGKLDTLHTDLGTTLHADVDQLEGYVDGVEGKLDTLNTDVDQLEGYVDGLETLTGALTEAAPASDTASSGLNGRLQRVAQRLTTLIGTLGTDSAAIQTVGGSTVQKVLDITRPADTAVYAANDVINTVAGATGTVQKIVGIGNPNAMIYLTYMCLRVPLARSGDVYKIEFFNGAPTTSQGDNAANVPDIADRAIKQRTYTFAATATPTGGNYAEIEVTDISIPLKCDSNGDLPLKLITVGGYTPAASALYSLMVMAEKNAA